MGSPITIEILEQIDRYLNGELSDSETVAFEKLIANDVLLQDEVKIQKHLFAIHNTTKMNLGEQEQDIATLALLKEKLKSTALQELSQKIRKAGQEHTSLIRKKKSKTKYLYYTIAASIAIVFSATLYFINASNGLNTYYQDNVNWEELPSFAVKGASENSFNEGETLFKKKDYPAAIASFSKIDTSNELYPYSLLYIGASYEQLNENEKALATFDKVTKLTNFEAYSQGYWYKLLLYLKIQDKQNALAMKTIILEDKNNYNYDKVVEMKLE